MISVITPTYLTPPEMFLRTYQSLLSQTHTDWEWVIIDDSPTDQNETWEMVRTYASRDARIRAFRPDRHSGSIGRNKRWGFMLAEGDILVELDHDDEMLPTCLAKVLVAFQANPATGFVYSDWAELLPDGQSTVYPEGWGFGYATTYWTDCPAPGRPGMWTMGTAPMNATTLRHIVSMPNHVRAWRASVYRDMNGHDPRYEVCDDYQLMVRTFLHTQFHHIPELLYLQHISPTSAQRQRNQAIQNYVAHIAAEFDEAITEALKKPFIPPPPPAPYPYWLPPRA
jgi:glycosyltransferase involved in cell wall biosynthesis